jgi:hypothetical protein
MKKIIFLIGLSLILTLIIGCDPKDGNVMEPTELPLDFQLDLYCENEGIHPETCILDNDMNPWADASVGMENVWDLSDECPSPKSKFYLWGTILANIPIGEYQYHTAVSLHEHYTAGGSLNAKEQAKKAYRAVLDHFFESVTWWNAWWVDEDTYYAVLIRELSAQNLYDPSENNLLPLYNDPAEALADMSEWGYVYDIETGTVTKIE